MPENDGSPVRTIGLGHVSSLGPVYSSIIQELEIPVVPLAECRKSNHPDYAFVTDKQICAGDFENGGKDSCQGDSGGPLFHARADGELELVGVVGRGKGCAQKQRPGLYTRVASYSEWIEKASQELAAPFDHSDMNNSLARFVGSRCLAQLEGIHEHIQHNYHTRTTMWSLDRSAFAFTAAGVAPSGTVLDHCEFEDAVTGPWKVMWIRPEAENQRVVAYVSTKDQGNWVSGSMSMRYRQDSLICDTARGPVSLIDSRNVTHLLYQDHMYELDSYLPDPPNDQTTWGCTIGDASVEMFDSHATPSQYGVRIHHPSLGTITRGLRPADVTTKTRISAEFTGVQGRAAKLVVSSKPEGDDLFTWQLSCLTPFRLNMGDHSVIESRPAGDGVFNEAIVESTTYPEGTVLAGHSATVGFESQINAPSGYGCVLNQVFVIGGK